jgi:2'-5' RNA ligase
MATCGICKGTGQYTRGGVTHPCENCGQTGQTPEFTGFDNVMQPAQPTAEQIAQRITEAETMVLTRPDAPTIERVQTYLERKLVGDGVSVEQAEIIGERFRLDMQQPDRQRTLLARSVLGTQLGDWWAERTQQRMSTHTYSPVTGDKEGGVEKAEDIKESWVSYSIGDPIGTGTSHPERVGSHVAGSHVMYHMTRPENVEQIRREGLRAPAYFYETPEDARIDWHRPDDVMLPVDLSGHPLEADPEDDYGFDEDGTSLTGRWRTQQAVGPEQLGDPIQLEVPLGTGTTPTERGSLSDHHSAGSSPRYVHYAPSSVRDQIASQGLRPGRELYPEDYNLQGDWDSAGDADHVWLHQDPVGGPPEGMDAWELTHPELYDLGEDTAETARNPYRFTGPIDAEHLRLGTSPDKWSLRHGSHSEDSPYRVGANADELHVALSLPDHIVDELHQWVADQDWPKGFEPTPKDEYHITLLYAPEGHEEHRDSDWIRETEGYWVKTTTLDLFGDDAVVLRIESPDVEEHADDLQDMAENRDIPISRFPGGYKPHITLGYGGKPDYLHPPKLRFKTKPSEISTPRSSSQEPPVQVNAKNTNYTPDHRVDRQQNSHRGKLAAPHAHITTGLPCTCPWGQQRLAKTAGKLEWLMERGDRFSQTPEGQQILNGLQRAVAAQPKVDALAPWLFREAKKGRVHYTGRGWIGPEGYVLDLGHIADWFESNSPTRRGTDIMQLDINALGDKIEAWDEELAAEMDQQRQMQGTVMHDFGDGWTVRRVDDAAQANDEGSAMGHCVGGYGHDIRSGNVGIFSLRDPQNQPHATVEIRPNSHDDKGLALPDNGKVHQIQGKQNSEPNEEYRSRLSNWFDAMGPARPSANAEPTYVPVPTDPYSLQEWHEPTADDDNHGYQLTPYEADEYGLDRGDEFEYEGPPDWPKVIHSLLHDGSHYGGEHDEDMASNVRAIAHDTGHHEDYREAVERARQELGDEFYRSVYDQNQYLGTPSVQWNNWDKGRKMNALTSGDEAWPETSLPYDPEGNALDMPYGMRTVHPDQERLFEASQRRIHQSHCLDCQSTWTSGDDDTREANEQPDQPNELAEKVNTLTDLVAQVLAQKESAPTVKRKLVVNRDQDGKIASIEEA